MVRTEDGVNAFLAQEIMEYDNKWVFLENRHIVMPPSPIQVEVAPFTLWVVFNVILCAVVVVAVVVIVVAVVGGGGGGGVERSGLAACLLGWRQWQGFERGLLQ